MRLRVAHLIIAALAQGFALAESSDGAAELQPADAWSRYELGNTLAGEKRYEEAVAAYHATLDLEPKNSEARLALARTLWADGQIAGARVAARAVLDYDPLNAEARKLLGELHQAPSPPRPRVQTRPASSRSRSGGLSEVDRAVAEAYASGRPEAFRRAATLLEDDLRREPRNVARRKTLAFLYLEKLREPAQALPHLEQVVAAEPNDSGWLQMLAKAHIATGNRRAAVDAYRRAAAAAPRDVWARYHLGCTLRDSGQHRQAEAVYREALALDPANRYVRRELARSAQARGRPDEAVEIVRDLIEENPGDAEAHALLGEIHRGNRDFSAASIAYHAALASDPAHPVATSGLREVDREKRPEAKLAFYTFDDTDGLRQTGIFSHVSTLVSGRLQASAYLNERFFRKAPGETSERFEAGVGLTYRFNGSLQASVGLSQFKTENLDRETGGYLAFYVAPMRALDFSISYRHADPVNDSYTTAREAFTQNSLSAALHVRPTRTVALDLTGSTADYSDGNTRRFALASLAWYLTLPASPVLRLEYEWLDFDERSADYSSPENYARVRPVIEFSPRLTRWLKLEFHGELSYVFDEREWGTGFTVGPRFQAGDSFDLGVAYMKYEIPGGQTTWSGDGFKVDLSWRF